MGSHQNVDRLSNMPQEVISHILSLMPTKFAVRTSILSKSWIHNWKSVTNLDIDDQHPFLDMHCFIKFVNRVLECCRASQVQLFRLRCSELWVPDATVQKWIDKATKFNVSEIEVHSILLDLPHPFFCKTLTKLTLVCHQYSNIWNITSPIDLPLLKTLDIKVLTNPNLNAFKIIHGCPLLESLSLEVIGHTARGDEEFNFNIPTLKRLELNSFKGIYVNKVVLNVPNLEELFVSGRLSSPVVMESFPPLVSVTLSCSCGLEPDQLWVELLTGISGAKSLTLGLLSNTASKSPMPKFLNLKHLEFTDVYGDRSEWRLINQIIDNSYELEHLCIQERPKSPYSIERPEDSCWIEPQSVSTCMLNNLRTVKFVNFKGRKSDIHLMAYMLGNAQVLKTLAIMCDSIPLEEELRLYAELSKLPRASRYCEIHFIASGSRSTST